MIIKRNFESELGEYVGFIKASASLPAVLYFAPLIINLLYAPMYIVMVLPFTVLYMAVLTFFLIYYIPKKIIVLTLRCGKILVYHEAFKKKDFTIRLRVSYSYIILSLLIIALIIAKHYYMYILTPPWLDQLADISLTMMATLALIRGLIPPVPHKSDSPPVSNYERTRSHAYTSTILMFILIFLIMFFPQVLGIISELLRFPATIIVSLLIVPLLIYIILNDIILAWYYKDYRKIGLVIMFPAFFAVITSASAIYFLVLYIELVSSRFNLLLELLYLLKKILFVILSSILMYSYLHKRTQDVLKPPFELGGIDNESAIHLIVDTVLVFVNDIINKIILYNIVWTVLVIIIELSNIDLTNYILTLVSGIVFGYNIIEPNLDFRIVTYYAFLIYVIYITIVVAVFKIFNFLRDLVDKIWGGEKIEYF
ncbi:MAG: hypothetical protein DRJ51_07465 [Thermoprotei archaeon]|nr:MAG: hypothetical protein DRJ51_07465 [Thermoprotei archaeon]